MPRSVRLAPLRQKPDRLPRRDLEVLNAISENQHITQRTLASKLGIAVGLANLYIKRLARKGYIKCVNVQSNRILYLLTPNGITEKSRLTYEFMQYSLDLYRRVRVHLASVLQPLCDSAHGRIAIYGRGEAAELAYLSLKELGLEPVAIFDRHAGGVFIGMAVHSIEQQADVVFDFLVVATLDNSDALADEIVRYGVPRDKLLNLRHRVPRADFSSANTGS